MFRSLRLLLLPLIVGLGACATLQANARPGEAQLVREVAAATGKSPARLTALLDSAHRQQSIIDAMTRPAEAKPWADYRKIFMTNARIDGGIAFWRQHRALLARVSARYGVPAAYIVAILGVETNYGRITGHYRVLDALVTLAFYYPPRADYFRRELKTLLELPASKLAGPVEDLHGSYAGAQGWGQFMPSSIKAYAVDADGDGHIDLMHSVPDIVASVANYFHAHGWQPGQPVAVRARARAAATTVKLDRSKPLHAVASWTAWGYAPTRAVNPELEATWLHFSGTDRQSGWLTFHNFYVITRYNHSPMYAMVVHQLAKAIAAGARSNANEGVAVVPSP